VDWVDHKLGNYVIEAEISRGGSAVVYRAYQPQLERRVAIKVLINIDAEDTEDFLHRFRSEAKAVAALRHPNILSIYDYGEEEGNAYIVMEYVPGGTIKDILTGEPIDWPTTAMLMLPLAQALAFSHARQIIHCDIKPGNILLPRPDWPLLADFGLYQIMNLPDDSSERGRVSGTPAYAAPEQLRGDVVDSRSDIYSLGLVIYEMLAGRLPFRSPRSANDIVQRLTRNAPPISFFNNQVDPELEQVIMRALGLNPDKRYQDMHSFIQDLSDLAGDSEVVKPMFVHPAHSTGLLSANPRGIGPHLIIIGTDTVLMLPEKENIIVGRRHPRFPVQPDIDLSPHGGLEAGVSRRHARLLHNEEGWYVEDMNSMNGTSVNMSHIQAGAPMRLRSGDMIRCGRLMIVFYESLQQVD
jgi:serine/threonine protein kinase